MILEGFEIENWTCIKKVSVSGLPTTGVIVLHGPNRRGKSSIVHALRACLMDYSSSTTALKSSYPRGTGEKPIVSVTFRVGGATYRIRKHFGSSKSELARQTSTGDWKVETASAADAHDRTCSLVGGSDSAKGLQQLLWLTQAEFRLPDAKKFDASLQSQLRGILGVLQTPLDDRFIEQVKKRWNTWYSGQRKAGKQQEIKDSCNLAENLNKLTAGQKELQALDGKFQETEALLRQAADLQQTINDLNRQLEERTRELAERQDEHRQCQTRILARQQAEKDHQAADKEQGAARDEQQHRAEAAQRCLEHENAIGPAMDKVEMAGQALKRSEDQQRQRQKELVTLRDNQRQLQNRANRAAAMLRALDDAEKLNAAQEDLHRAQAMSSAASEIEAYLSEHPTPDKESLEALKDNRQRVATLQASRDAAAMNLTLAPQGGAAVAQLAMDGGPPRDLQFSAEPAVLSVQRKAELFIDGWGRIEFSRGAGKGDLDEIEDELRRRDEEFSSAVAPLGINGSGPDALEQLIQREAEHRLKKGELDSRMKELRKLAPKGLGPLQAKLLELQTKLKAVPASDPADTEPLPAEREELDALAANVQREINCLTGRIDRLENEAGAAATHLDELRREETAAKAGLAACKAAAKSKQEELDRLRTHEQIAQRLQEANRALEISRAQLIQTELTEGERTINERLKTAHEAVEALRSQSAANIRKYDVIKGRLLESEGLYAQRSSLAARVDELMCLTQRESLEKDAVDRLYAQFEECRDKQLGTLMGPIHQRVLGWMRALDIGDYQEVRFNDAFLPDKLLSRDGTAEFTVAEESTGAREQIGMLVRLALGSTLASASEPAVALLDDPLTHCDIGRLNRMRGILRRAAEGDQNLNPPAGPLQVIILTCHPEWFRDDKATVIDLEHPEVMSRWAV